MGIALSLRAEPLQFWIYMFGAYFDLGACSYAVGTQEKETASKNAVSRVSDVFALLGTAMMDTTSSQVLLVPFR